MDEELSGYITKDKCFHSEAYLSAIFDYWICITCDNRFEEDPRVVKALSEALL